MQRNKEYEAERSTLLEDIRAKEACIDLLQSELAEFKERCKRYEKGKGQLDEILSVGKRYGDRTGLGYIGEHSKSKGVFVKAQTSDVAGKRRTTEKRRNVICYYYKFPRHYQNQCFRLKDDQRFGRAKLVRRSVNQKTQALRSKYIWVKKEILNMCAAHTDQSKLESERVFNSGCSSHKTRDKNLLIDVDDVKCGHVIFKDVSYRRKALDDAPQRVIHQPAIAEQKVVIEDEEADEKLIDGVCTPETHFAITPILDEATHALDVEERRKACSGRVQKNYTQENVIGNVNKGIKTRVKSRRDSQQNVRFVGF